MDCADEGLKLPGLAFRQRAWFRGRGISPGRYRTLGVTQVAHHLEAEERVNAFDNLGRHVLYKDTECGCDPEMQHRRVVPGQPLWNCAVGDALTDDRRPFGDKLDFREAPFAKRRFGDRGQAGSDIHKSARRSFVQVAGLFIGGHGEMVGHSSGNCNRRADLADSLLAWYDRNRRDLPWRSPPGVRPDPYVVWLSEIMLQQTTVSAVRPYFEDFRRRWPTITDLAAEDLDRVLQAWAGLGYYARARNLHKCAREVVARYGASFPEDETSLLGLPGIGPYTAAAISAIAFGRRAAPVDGNAERVLSRLFAVSLAPQGAAENCDLDNAKRALRGLRPGRHGSRGHDLQAEGTSLHPMPVAGGLRCGGRGQGGGVSAPKAQARSAGPLWCCFLDDGPRGPGPAPSPAGKRSSRRNDGIPVNGVAFPPVG